MSNSYQFIILLIPAPDMSKGSTPKDGNGNTGTIIGAVVAVVMLLIVVPSIAVVVKR